MWAIAFALEARHMLFKNLKALKSKSKSVNYSQFLVKNQFHNPGDNPAFSVRQ
jgi:hypothetical protein